MCLLVAYVCALVCVALRVCGCMIVHCARVCVWCVGVWLDDCVFDVRAVVLRLCVFMCVPVCVSTFMCAWMCVVVCMCTVVLLCCCVVVAVVLVRCSVVACCCVVLLKVTACQVPDDPSVHVKPEVTELEQANRKVPHREDLLHERHLVRLFKTRLPNYRKGPLRQVLFIACHALVKQWHEGSE